MDSGKDCGIVLRHALAHADDLWRMAVENGMTGPQAAKTLGLPKIQCMGVIRLLREVGHVPSRARMAVCAMNDFGWDDQDIAEVFSMPVAWAQWVRKNRDHLRKSEPFALELEYVDEGLRPQDPDPTELYRRAAALRAKRERGWTMLNRGRLADAPAQGGLRNFAWNGRHASFISIVSEAWTGCGEKVG
jgi:hypothetical protein